MKLVYCPGCSAPLRQENATSYVCENGHPYWNNSRAAVCVIILDNDKALFSKRARAPHKDKYDFPGGFVDFGENAWQTVARELREETGLRCSGLSIIDSTFQLYEENTGVCDFIFVSSDWSGEPKAADDVATLEWKPIEFIDSAEFAWNYAGLVQRLKQYVKDKEREIT